MAVKADVADSAGMVDKWEVSRAKHMGRSISRCVLRAVLERAAHANFGLPPTPLDDRRELLRPSIAPSQLTGIYYPVSAVRGDGDLLMKSRLRLVEPSNISRQVAPGRATNAELRTREYLTPAEIERLIKAAKEGRWGLRDATMILVS